MVAVLQITQDVEENAEKVADHKDYDNELKSFERVLNVLDFHNLIVI